MNYSVRNRMKAVLLIILLLAVAVQAQVPAGKSQAGQLTPQATGNPVTADLEAGRAGDDRNDPGRREVPRRHRADDRLQRAPPSACR
jgi:hypothetical protein